MKKITFLQNNRLVLMFTVFALSVSVVTNAQITPFTMTLTPTDETCTGNGQITIDITGTQAGAVFEFNVYLLPNVSIPIRTTNGVLATGTTLTHTETSLPSGDYQIIATQVVVGEGSNQQTETVTIVENIEAVVFDADIEQICNGGEVTVNVTAGNSDTYELRDLSNNIVVPAQSSNVINAPYGDYNVIVVDVCGNATSLGVTIADDFEQYSIRRSNNSFGSFRQMIDCNTISHTEQLRYNGSTAIPSYRFPIDVLVTVENPTGGPDTVMTDTWTSNANQNSHYDVPFYDGEIYDYTVTFTDACGEIVSTTDQITATISSRLLTFAANCNAKYLRFDVFRFYLAPVEFTFTTYPVGFDPADYNTNFTPGAYTGTIDPLDATVAFGDASTGVPEGTYEIELTTCGRTEVKTITVTNDVTYSIRPIRNYPGCGDDEGSTNFHIRTSTGTSNQTDDITSVTITSAPAAYTGPTDISYGITADGQFQINSLPSGEYTFEITGTCGIPINYTVDILSKDLTSTVTPTYNCGGSFNVETTVSSNLGGESAWLQKFYPASGQWGHPTTGILYTEGNHITSARGLLFFSGGNANGYDTHTGTVNNVAGDGEYRVILQSTIIQTGGGNPLYCHDVLDNFNVSATGINLTNYYVANCIGGNSELVIDASGVAPLNYTITQFNGNPLIIDNGTDPIFSELALGEYTVEIEDGCGNVRVFQFKTDAVKLPVIHPSNLCDGQVGVLFVPGLSFLDIEWTKDADPTVIGTGNTLEFNTFNAATDTGIYYATLTYNPNPNACISQVLSFEVQAPAPPPEAGTGQTEFIVQENAGVINLFDYVTAPYDNYGSWEDLSNTGFMNNEIWDASTLPVGEYQFQYTVDGLCTDSDSTIVTISIVSSGLTVVADVVNNLCPFIAATDVFNVMDNDVVSGIPVNQSEFTISTETPDSEGIITVNADGSVDVAVGAQPGTIYTLEYRITEIAIPTNFAIGTLTVTISEDTTPPAFVEALPADTTVECDAVPTEETLTATDDCGDATVTFEETRTDGACANSYTLTRTWTATDVSGNETEHIQTITVEDTTAPVLNAESLVLSSDLSSCNGSNSALATADYIQSNILSTCTADVFTSGTGATIFSDGTSGYSYGSSGCVFTSNPNHNDPKKLGIGNNAIVAFKLSNTLVSGQTYYINVDAYNNPATGGGFPCPSVLPEKFAFGTSSSPNSFGNPVAVMASDLQPALDFAWSNHTVSFVAPNDVDTYLTIQLEDQTNGESILFLNNVNIYPELPQDIIVSCDAIPTAETLTATDNCTADQDVVFEEEIVEGSCTNSYEIVRTWTATDDCGNETVHTQTITVEDTAAPTFDTTPPTDAITVECTEDIPAAAVITASDSCGEVTVYVDELRIDGACFGQYTIERRWVAVDECGNQTISDPQIITVDDQTGPTFNEELPQDLTLECTDTIPDAEVLTATDCTYDIDNDTDVNFKLDGSLLLNIQEAMNGYDTNNGDAYGVVGTWLVNDYLYDHIPGTSNPPTPIPNPLPEYDGITFTITTTNLATGTEPNRVSPNFYGSGVDLRNARIEITFSDELFFSANGHSNLRAQEYVEFSGDGTKLVPYPNNNQWDATHDISGLITSVTGPYALYNPSPFDPSNVNANVMSNVRSIYAGTGTTLIIEETHPTGQGNLPLFHVELFPAQDLVVFEEETVAGTCANSYEIVRTWTATDDCGNETVHTQTITIEDNTAPTFDTTPPTDAITVECTEDIPVAAVITATDSCGEVTVYVDELRIDGACFGQYTIERRWVAIDECGNQTISDPQIITVDDQTGPTFNEELPQDLALECTDTIPDAEVLTATDCTYDIDNDADGNFKLDGSVLLNIQEAMNGYDTSNGDAYGVVGTWLVNDYLYTFAEGTQTPQIPNPLSEYDGITFTITTTNIATATEPSRVSPNGFGSGVNSQC